MRRALIALALVLAAIAPGGADPNSNQLTSWSALCTGKTEGVYSWSGSQPANCTNLPGRAIQWPDFTANVTHTGTGCGTANPLPTWGQLLTCRGTGTTQVSQSINGEGITYTTDGTTCTPSGTSTLTFSTPSNTVAPTSGATQLTLSLTSVAQYTGDIGTPTGTGITYSLNAPGGGAIYTNVAVANGTTPSPTYSNGSAVAGSYTWTIGGLGSETCTGVAPSKHVNNANAEQFSGSIKWYQ